MFVDHFGNALTNVDAEDLARAFPEAPEPALEVRVLDHTIRGLARSYGEHPLGTMVAVVGSFDVEFSESGADRNWQNSAFSSGLFSPEVGCVYVLPVAALLGRSALILVRVTPTVAQPYAGKVQVMFLGYKFVQGDSVQP